MVCVCKWDLGNRQLRWTVRLFSAVVWTRGPWFSDKVSHAVGSNHFPWEALLALGETVWICLVPLPSVVADNHRVAIHVIAAAFRKWSAWVVRIITVIFGMWALKCCNVYSSCAAVGCEELLFSSQLLKDNVEAAEMAQQVKMLPVQARLITELYKGRRREKQFLNTVLCLQTHALGHALTWTHAWTEDTRATIINTTLKKH